MKYIEFAGIPGVGKSAVCDALVKRMKKFDSQKNFLTIDEAFCCVSKLKIDRCYRWLLTLCPSWGALLLADKLKNRSIMQFNAQNRFISLHGGALKTYLMSDEYSLASHNDRASSISYFLDAGSNYTMASENLDDDYNVFFSEGFVQKSFMFLISTESELYDSSLLERYFSEIPHPNILIYVKADPELCFNRLMTRPRGLPMRLRHLCEKDILNYLYRANNHLMKSMNFLSVHCGIDIIEVENSGVLDEIVCECSDLLRDGLELY